MSSIKTMLLNDLDITPIKSVRLGMMSDEERLKRSAFELVTGEIYSGNVPLAGGLADPRGGATDTSVCSTCRCDMSLCPGHFGHLKLATPIYSPAFFTPYLKKLLECVCWTCHKLLLEPNRWPPMSMTPKKRFHYIYKICHDKRTPSSSKDVKCPHCTTIQPTIIKNSNTTNALNLYASVTRVESGKSIDDTARMDSWISAEVVLNIFRGIPTSEAMVLGFDRRYNAPESMIWKVLTVPPPTIRPAVRYGVGGARGEDDITMVLREIFKINQKLNTLLTKDDSDLTKANNVRNTTIELQHAITALVDNEHGIKPLTQSRSGKPYKTISSRLGGKTGRLRANLLGKRVNHSARTVASADPCLSINEVGIPYKVAMNLTVPEVVTPWNIKLLTKFVENGPWKHPGAIYYRSKGNALKYSIVEGNAPKLMPGDTVYRHLINGDPVLVNRQPTLHRLSMMTHKVRVLPQNTIRISVAVTDAYAGDFDGDEFNMHVHQSVQTACELLHLSQPQLQMLRPRNARPCICIKQDVPVALYHMSKEGILLAKDAANIACTMNGRSYDLVGELVKERKSGTLKPADLFSLLFHPKLNVNIGSKFIIEDGKLVKGVLGADQYKKYSKGVLHSVISEFGAEESRNLLDNTQKIAIEWLMQHGFSVGIKDLLLTDENTAAMEEARKTIKEKAHALVLRSRTKAYRDPVLNRDFKSAAFRFEKEMAEACDLTVVEGIFEDGVRESNRFKQLIESGSKGVMRNLMHMNGVIGQQMVQGSRIEPVFDNRTTPHFCKFDNGMEARGFVSSCYISGLGPTEFFFAAIKGREGLLDTALSTSECGYAQRKLVKALEDLRISHELLVVDANDNVIQFAYGEDGVDTGKTEEQDIGIVALDMEKFSAIFKWDNSLMAKHTSAAAMSDSDIDSMLQYYLNLRYDVVGTVYQGELPTRSSYEIDSAINLNKMLLHFKVESDMSDMSNIDLVRTIDSVNDEFLYMYKIKNTGDEEGSSVHGGIYNLTRLTKLILNPQEVIVKRHWKRSHVREFMLLVAKRYLAALAYPGEMVGILAAQSIGEQVTQSTLDNFKSVKTAGTVLTLTGIPRIKEILAFTSTIKSPCMKFPILNEDEFEGLRKRVEHLKLGDEDLMKDFKIMFCNVNTLVKKENITGIRREQMDRQLGTASLTAQSWFVVIDLNYTHFDTKVLELSHIVDILIKHIAVSFKIYFDTPMPSEAQEAAKVVKIIVALDLTGTMTNRDKLSSKAIAGSTMIDDNGKCPDIYSDLLTLKESIEKLTVSGMMAVKRMIQSAQRNVYQVIDDSDNLVEVKAIQCQTEGTDLLSIMALEGVVARSATSNDFYDVLNTLGIEAAKCTIIDEMALVLQNADYSAVSYRHILLLADFATATGGFTSFERFGFAKSDRVGPMAKASFERTAAMLIDSAAFGEVENMAGVSANLIFGQLGKGGTAVSEILLDSRKLKFTEESAFDQEMYGDDTADAPLEDPDDIRENNDKCRNLFRDFEEDVDLEGFHVFGMVNVV